jgi:hypothetical protein
MKMYQLSMSWTKKKKHKHCQQLRLIVKNVETMKLSGGCFRQEVQMNPLRNFIDASNVAILGETTREPLPDNIRQPLPDSLIS